MGKQATLLILSLITAYSLRIHAAVSFANPVPYTVGKDPDWVAARDVNGDGWVDLIVLEMRYRSISVLTNSGAGLFVAAPRPQIDGGTWRVNATDIDGDGQVDLACTSYFNTGEISLLTNDGSGGFHLSAKLQLPYPPDETLATDLNFDGKADLVRAANTSISVYTNDGMGHIPFLSPYASGYFSGGDPTAIVPKDINNDGIIDLVLAHDFIGNFSVVINNGIGALTEVSSPRGGRLPYTCAVADVNGDGRADLISVDSYDDTLTILTNGGNAGFAVSSRPTTGPYPYTVVPTDLDGDGKPELICANASTNTIAVFPNTGAGIFGQAQLFVIPGTNSSRVAAADLNNDGKQDLVVADVNGSQIWVLINTTSFAPPSTTPRLQIASYGNRTAVEWPAALPGWSLQQSPDISTAIWHPAGYGSQEIADVGTNKSFTLPKQPAQLFFRLFHP